MAWRLSVGSSGDAVARQQMSWLQVVAAAQRAGDDGAVLLADVGELAARESDGLV
jgi:hypothetical protein